MTDIIEKYSAPALEKGLDVLELLASNPEGMSKSEIAKRLDRTISEIFRMLVVLERRGYIIADGDSEKYTLTLKLFQLSHRFPPVRRLGIVSAKFMQQLTFELHQSCHLAVYYSGKAHVVAQQDPPSDVIFAVRMGVELSLASSCSGHILLAYADNEQRARMIWEIADYDPSWSSAKLTKVVDEVRDRGYEVMDSPRTAGSLDIGFPIFDYNGQVSAALVVPYLPRLDEAGIGVEEVISSLRKASRDISMGLGYVPPA